MSKRELFVSDRVEHKCCWSWSARDGASKHPDIYAEFDSEEDARLFVAAPDLLNLLQRLEQWDHMDTAADGKYWRGEIQDAIAKATGETP